MSRSRLSLAGDAVIALALFGCIPVVVKYVSANAYTIGIFRLSVATLALAAAAAWKRQLRRVPGRDLLALAVIGTLFFAHWLTYFLSIKISSASIAAIGLSTYGVDLMILGALAGHGRIRPGEIAAVVLAIAGAVIVVPDYRATGSAALGMLLALASALFYATLPVLHQRYAHLPHSIRTLGQFGFALLLFLFFLPKANWNLSSRDWAGLVFLAVAATLIAHSLWVRVTTTLSPSLASVIYYGNVPFAVVLGVIVLHEPVTWRTIGGALLIVAGSVIGIYPRWRESGEFARRGEGTAAPV